MIKDIKEQTAEIVIAAVEKVLEEKINPKKDKELIEKSLAKLNYED
jgi:F0F1-type ATP synthase membrane subunit b/b'